MVFEEFQNGILFFVQIRYFLNNFGHFDVLHDMCLKK